MKKRFLFPALLFVFIAIIFTIGCTNHLLKPHQSDPSILVQLEKSNGARNATTGDYQITAWIENRDGTESHHQKINATADADTSITFEELVIGSQINIHLELTKNDDSKTKLTGESGWINVKEGEQVIKIPLESQANTDDSGEGNGSTSDGETEGDEPAIVDAETPTIAEINSVIEPYPTDPQPITTTLEAVASVTDGGTLTYQWYSNTTNSTANGTLIKGATNATYEAQVGAGETKYFYCIVTNTNNSVNGTKTASATSNIATVASIEGQLDSITAHYTGTHELVNEDITYSNIQIQQTYIAGSETQVVPVQATKEQYTITLQEPTNTIGYVPATVTHKTFTGISADFTIPVKYQLDEVYLSGAVDSTIAQYTGSHSLSATYNDTSVSLKLYQNNTSSELTDYVNYTWHPSTVDNTKTTSYTLTLSSKNEWCILPSEGITKEVTVSVTPWTLEINPDSPENLAGGQGYTLTAKNTSGTATGITYESDNTSFSISGNTLTTPAATTSPQSATIAAKYNGQTLATLVVRVPAPSYDPAVGLSYDSSTNTLTIYNEAGLKNFRNIVNGDFTSGNITVGEKTYSSTDRTVNAILENNITLTEQWTPIARESYDPYPYQGTFDGNKKSISELQISSTSTKPQGFFGALGSGATVKNLTVKGNISSNYYAGGIAGYIDGATIEYCVNEINITNNSAGKHTGGIAGYISSTQSTITGCVNFGAITGIDYVGGILGGSNSNQGATVDKCINLGAITTVEGGTGHSGGIYGKPATTNDIITNCLNLGSITSYTNTSAGIAWNQGVNMAIRYCLSVGDMSNTPEGTEGRQPLAYWIQDDSLNYYDSDKISSSSNSIEGTGRSTSALKVASTWDTSWTTTNWSFASGRYPVPNIQDKIPSDIWNEIVEAAK